MDYLVRDVLAKNEFHVAHGFVRDRTRGIRQDFVYQNYRKDEAVHVYEKIARFHILAMHRLSGKASFDAFQEMEQLRKTLTSLAEYYKDAAKEGRFYPSEPEFRAYSIILLARERDIERLISEWPEKVRQSEDVQLAVLYYQMLQRNSMPRGVRRRGLPEVVSNTPATFFRLVRDPKTPYLMACLLEFHFGDVRRMGMNMIVRHYRGNIKRLTMAFFRKVFAYDSDEAARADLEAHGVEIVRGNGIPDYVQFDKFFTAGSYSLPRSTILYLHMKQTEKTYCPIRGRRKSWKLKEETDQCPKSCSAPTSLRLSNLLYGQKRRIGLHSNSSRRMGGTQTFPACSV